MRKTVFVIFVLLFLLDNINAKNIGIAWVGKAAMQDSILRGFLDEINKYNEDLNIELQKELSSVKELKTLALQWDKNKDAMILLRSNAAKMLATTKTTIPTFIGGTNHPIELGTIKDFLSPEGNITGVTYYIDKKTTLRMIKLFIPNLKSILFIGEKGHPSTPLEQKETKMLSSTMLNVKYYEIISDELNEILKKTKNQKEPITAIVLGNQSLVMDNAGLIVKAAGSIPVFSYSKISILRGALAGYVADNYKLGTLLAQSVYAVLYQNKKIKEIPIKIDKSPLFYVNKKTQKRMNIKIPIRLNQKVIFIEN